MIEMMMGAYIYEEIWWDGTGMIQCGNHVYYMPDGDDLYRVYTDNTDHVMEIEKV